MFKTETNFKIGYLNRLKEEKFEITLDNGYLDFYIEGKDNDNLYSLSFITTIKIEEMLEFKQYEHIDFIKYLDDGDIVFGKNGVFDLDTDIKIDIVRYLPNSFVLDIDFKDGDGVVGSLELIFTYERE